MTKSYVVGWFAALFAFGAMAANASIEDEGLPLFPLVELESSVTSSQSQSDMSTATDNLVEVEVEEQGSGPREFVIFVVRHMEKEESKLDPGLTGDGVRRAEALAQLVSSAGVERIYSTHYRRSAGTALPLARALALPVEFYQSDTKDELVAALLDGRQSALVVGHSNTVAELVTGLGGVAEALSEAQFGDIFQLLIRTDGEDHDVRQVHLKAPLVPSERRSSR